MSATTQFETNGEPFIFPNRLRAKAALLKQIKISKSDNVIDLVQYDTEQSALNRLIGMSERDEFSETRND
jgi:hypothetical protein